MTITQLEERGYVFCDRAKELMAPHAWAIAKSGYIIGHVKYVPGKAKLVTQTLHRFLIEKHHGITLTPSDIIEHLNDDRKDNRLCNLQVSTKKANTQNMKRIVAHNSTGYRNVCFDKARNRYLVSLKVDGKLKHIGRYKTIEEANDAAESARLKYMPHYRRLS